MIASVKPNQSEKRQKFRELAESRTNRAIEAVLRIGNLSNRQIYEWDDAEVKKVIPPFVRQSHRLKADLNLPKVNWLVGSNYELGSGVEMTSHSAVAPLRVGDEDFLVTSMIERCPKTMMLRELAMNALEAARHGPEDYQLVEIRPYDHNGASKLVIWNTGPGMNALELHHMCDIAASIGKEKSLTGNFGMGAKVASLPSNQHGMRYRSCKEGRVSEVILCKREETYGRLRRKDEHGEVHEVVDVTDAAVLEGYDTSTDWTEVMLLGNPPIRTRCAIPTTPIPCKMRNGLRHISTTASIGYRPASALC